jgi:hypothetical protein
MSDTPFRGREVPSEPTNDGNSTSAPPAKSDDGATELPKRLAAKSNLRFRTRLLCALTGAWGVATGYALFILISNRTEGVSRSTAAFHFLVVLVVAVLVVWLTEWFRDTIRGEESVSTRSLSAILSSVLLLAVFEVCVLAYEEVSQATFESPYAVKELAARISGKQIPYAFLRPEDILKPRELVKKLSSGYQQMRRKPSPEAWIAYQLGPEMQWTLFPDQAARPTWHDALVRTIEMEPYLRDSGAAGSQGASDARSSNAGTGPGGPAKNKSEKVSASQAPDEDRSPWESVDYDTLLHKLYFLEGLDNEQLAKNSQIYVPDPAKGQELFTDFAPLMGRQGLKAEADVTIRDMSDEQLRDLLAIELNRTLLWKQFYNQEQFGLVKTPAGVKQLLGQQSEDVASDNALTPQLKDLESQPESEELDDKITEVRDELERARGRLLPAPRMVQLNRELLVAAFPDDLKPAPKRFDEHGANLAVLGLLWMCAGGTLGWILAGAIFDPQGPGKHPSRRGALRGLAAALGAAPVFVVGYVLVVRLGTLVWDTLHFPHELHYLWEPNNYPPSDLFGSTLVPALLRLDAYWDHKWRTAGFAAAIVVALAVFWQWHGRRRGMSAIKRWLLFGACVVTLALLALLSDANLGFIFLLVGLVWITPAVFIGVCGPYLRTRSSMPQGWGIIAVMLGLGLVLLTIVRLKWDDISPWLLVPGVVLIATGMLMRAGLRLEEYWPLGALALGLVVCGMSAVVQQATFVGVLSDVHELNAYGGYGRKLVPEIPKPPSRMPRTRPPEPAEQIAGTGARGCGIGYEDSEPCAPMTATAPPELSASERSRSKIAPGNKKPSLSGAKPNNDDDLSESSYADDHMPVGPTSKTGGPADKPEAKAAGLQKVDSFKGAKRPSGGEGGRGPEAAAEWKAAHQDPYDDYYGPRDDQPQPSPTREQLLDQGMKNRIERLRQDARGMASTGDWSMDDWVRSSERSDQDRLRVVRDRVARRLELAIVGSFGFWLTVGLLAGWSLQRNSADQERT